MSENMSDPSAESPGQSETPRTGYGVIQDYLKTLDSSPGVYRMLDHESRVLYVGKARNLRRGCRITRAPATRRASRK